MKKLCTLAVACLLAGYTYGSSLPVEGKITNPEGHPYAHAQVVVKGTETTVLTDSEGRYVLTLPEGAATLVIIPREGKSFEVSLKPGEGPQHIVAAPAPEAAQSSASFQAGAWTMGFSGNMNAHYIYTTADNSGNTVLGQPLLNTGDGAAHSVQNGLLPAALTFTAGTVTADSFQLGVNITPFVSLVSNEALAYSPVDFRQIYFTFGKRRWGSFKVGRDFGLFGFDAIIGDISLVGVGPNAAARNPIGTTLAGIGYGYIYCDRLSQINYTTPTMGGFNLTLGVYQPLNPISLGAPSDVNGNLSTSPGFHGKLAYNLKTDDGLAVQLSSAFISQQMNTGISDFQSFGIDFFGKLSVAGFEVAGTYYTGSGIGTTALFSDVASLTETGDGVVGDARNSSGYYGQLAYTVGKTKLGANYGVSLLDRNENDDPEQLLARTQRLTFGVYHALTPGLTILGEFSNYYAESHASSNNRLTNNGVNIGAFIGF